MIASDGDIPVFGQVAAAPAQLRYVSRGFPGLRAEKKVLTLEDAVRRMSAYPAQRLRSGTAGCCVRG
jgi:dihydroorotase/N-acyl-D-amino-acid deacylase